MNKLSSSAMHAHSWGGSTSPLFWVPLLILAVVPSFLGETYLTETQAVKIAIPGAVFVTSENRPVTQADRESLERKSGQHFSETSFKFFFGHDKDGKNSGYAVIM